MSTQIAYCKHCNGNTPVTDTMPQQQINMYIIFVVVYLTIIFGLMTVGDIMGGAGFASATPGTWLTTLGVPAFVLIVDIARSKNKLYCSKCGAVVGTKVNAKPKCMYCHANMESGATFCPTCGKRYKDNINAIVCKKCKTENTSDATFCTKCGTKLQKTKNQRTSTYKSNAQPKTTDMNEWSNWE